ncbi:MAG: hypothetical protein HYU86_08845 [Chloroflexi bacterium]|nr:hypothetical protein [Chloroflexota bacterium]
MEVVNISLVLGVALLIVLAVGLGALGSSKEGIGTMTILNSVYVVVMGFFIALLMGLGIAVFYEAPQRPAFPPPRAVAPPPPGVSTTPEERQRLEKEQQREMEEFQGREQAYQEEVKTYQRNVFFIALPLGVILLLGALYRGSGLGIHRFGLLVGGAFTAIYGTIQYLGSMGSRGAFVMVAVGLVILYLTFRQLSGERVPETPPES